jgi:hypothetical protein
VRLARSDGTSVEIAVGGTGRLDKQPVAVRLEGGSLLIEAAPPTSG